MGDLFLGIDVGTQGARAVGCTADGSVVARSAAPLDLPAPHGPQEQDPADWWEAVCRCLRELGPARRRLRALALSCTSGTLCVLDAHGGPVLPAMLYSDPRGAGHPQFDSSWAAAKLAWLAEHRPDVVDSAACFTSPGGYLSARLTGRAAPIDYSQALKFGYDLSADRWPADAGVAESKLPAVVSPGTPIGEVAPDVAAALDLPRAVEVRAGLTDGVAAQMACGPRPDVWVTVLGSTLVWKGVSDRRIDDAALGVYSHRGPRGTWFPGAASNAGGRILSEWFDPGRLAALDASVGDGPPPACVYPSVVTGERFPFRAASFVPFADVAGLGEAQRYAGCLAGAAFVERWGYDVFAGLGCPRPARVATTGGATRSRAWLQLRADVLGCPLAVPAEPSSAFGAAVTAAAAEHGDLLEAARAMVRRDCDVEPQREHATAWGDAYSRFRTRCQRQLEECR